MNRPAPRRTVLAAALAAATGAAAPTAGAVPRALGRTRTAADSAALDGAAPIDHHAWTSYPDWRFLGTGEGIRAERGCRPGIVIDHPAGTTEYTDPHTGRTGTWETASWTSPARRLRFGAGELVASWNAHTPPGTWIQVEMRGTYCDGAATPWYVLGRWAAGDADIKRTSLDDQTDGRSTISTDTFAIDDPASALRLTCYRLRVTLYRAPGTDATPRVWRVGAMASDIPGRFTVPASAPGEAAGIELRVPRYSQEIHKGQYPEYDNGGEAWCSPTSTQMAIEFLGRRPAPGGLAWVNPSYADPQVCHAARSTYDHQYRGCGNWPFNAAYAATYPDLEAAVIRLRSLRDVERLVAAGLPVMTSQSFLKEELDGAGYGTSGHLMCLVGFTADGDVIANDPAAPDNPSVRRVYRRRQFENVWLRTKRRDASGKIKSGTGGIAYLYWPLNPASGQRRALRSVGIR